MADSLLVDVSKYQGPNVPFDDLAAAGIIGAIPKCTHGVGGIDPTFARNWKASRMAGLARTAYFWFVPEQDPIAQVNHCLDVIDKNGGLDDDDMSVMMDFEQATAIKGQRLIDLGVRAIMHLNEQTGRKKSIFYTGKWYWIEYCLDLDSQEIADQDYAHAEYPSMKKGLTYDATLHALGGPHLSKPFASRKLDEMLWQFDGDGGLKLPNGVDSDFNRYRGTRIGLDAHIASTLIVRPDDRPTFPETPVTLLRAGEGQHSPPDIDED